jgi:hypothetical protein
MGSTENKELMRHAFAELANGNSVPFIDSLGDDVRWTIIGTTAWSRTYDGKRAVLGELLAPLNAQLRGRNIVSAHRLIAEDDIVVVEGSGQNTTVDGTPYRNTYCWVCRLAGGQVRELTEYADTDLIATALTAP